MQKIINFLQETEQFRDIKDDVLKSPFHSYMLITNDNILLEAYSLVVASFLVCKNLGCFKCNDCLKVLLKSHPDVFNLPKNENFLVEDAKFIIDNAGLVPMEAENKVFIINNFSSSNVASQNKLLKILEEPPKNTFFILLVNNPNQVLPTVMSRCKKIYIKNLKNSQIESFLKESVSEDKSKLISEISKGNLTKAINLSSNENYVVLIDSVIGVLTHLKHSSTNLELVNMLLTHKNKTSEILELFESYFEDILLISLSKPNLITNKSKENILNKLASEFSPTAVDLIIKRIYELKKRLKANCNINGIYDEFLLYILEVKATCNIA